MIGPDVVVVAAELGDDGRQRRTDDGLVERAKEQAEHDREEDLHLLAVAQPEGGILLERRGEPADFGGNASMSAQSLPWAR